MCIRQFAPLQVSSWKEIPNEDINTMWIFLKSYLKCKDCPNDVNEDDWRWLIENKWETQKFKKDKDSNEWPNDIEVWKASRTKSNGTWSVPNREEIMAQEKIVLQTEIEASKKREKNLEEEVAKFKEIAQAALDKQAAEIKQIFAHLASNQGLQNMLSNASPSTTSSED
nr:putative transposase [Ipomoea batatas]